MSDESSRVSGDEVDLEVLMRLRIPFNVPHGIVPLVIERHRAETLLPFQESNLNHIGTLHAAAFFTCAEYATGLVLAANMPMDRYLLLMKEAHIQYSKRYKGDAVATCTIDSPTIQSIQDGLVTKGKAVFTAPVVVRGQEGTELCRAEITWHLSEMQKRSS